ncbi:MAG: lipopolysaccharide kinase InaA family protein [Bacteroidota bacterium]|nr:lipopolysaccharide kinase InaA family protein [Bacteroidota bacterium]
MKIVINPSYRILNSFVSNIPTHFEQEGELVYTARNQLKHFSVEGYDVIVKRYKVPHLINRIAYTFFRPSKAKRAYNYALKLLQLGVDSPDPIAYIEQYKGGLLTHGYFISIYEKDYSVIRELMTGTQKDESLLKELSYYIADFHRKGVLHLDMSPGNILYKKDANHTQFTLIDINRMQFLPTISNEKRFKSFKRLSENEIVLTEIAKLYAAAAHLDEAEAIEKINQYSTDFFASRKRFKVRKKKKS